MFCPVTHRAAGPARKTATSATSSGWPMRRNGDIIAIGQRLLHHAGGVGDRDVDPYLDGAVDGLRLRSRAFSTSEIGTLHTPGS
jgi:hypothetical protein